MLSANGLQFCSKRSQAVCQLLGIRKLATSSYHPSGNGGVECMNHTVAQMLAMAFNENRDDWAYTSLASNSLQQLGQRCDGLGPQRGAHGRLQRWSACTVHVCQHCIWFSFSLFTVILTPPDLFGMTTSGLECRDVECWISPAARYWRGSLPLLR